MGNQYDQFLAFSSAAASGWAGWALAHPEFGSSVNPITTRGADYAHHITASPPGFEIPAASLQMNGLIKNSCPWPLMNAISCCVKMVKKIDN